MTLPAHRQSAADLRFAWGLAGARAVAADVGVAVVVDVLSFTTTTTVALDAGATVLPWRWRDAWAADEAHRRDAVLAVGRSAAGPGQPSLSPAGMRRAARAGTRVLLPSPNGATIAAALSAGSATCVAASLRNVSAVGRWLAGSEARSVAVVAAGEQWPDGSLRPAVEDLWGAGAVIDAVLRRDARRTTSPEARVARAAFGAVAPTLSDELHACASGLELVEDGFAEDVAVAAELDASQVVPVLVDRCFVPATTLRS
ncbi:MAG: 2-phosphosulfolactate phosphatase [Marmoricola sp.]